MPCGHVRGVAEPERARGGNRWLQNPLPLVFPLPVCLSPSLLRSFHGQSVHLAGRKACCFDASSCDQRGDPARGLCRLRPRAPPSVPLLSWRPHGSGITAVCLCMRLVLVKSPREFPELIHTHTPTFQQGGKVIGFADARVASEKVVGSLTQLFKVFYILFFFFATVLHHTTLEFLTLGSFCPAIFQPFLLDVVVKTDHLCF